MNANDEHGDIHNDVDTMRPEDSPHEELKNADVGIGERRNEGVNEGNGDLHLQGPGALDENRNVELAYASGKRNRRVNQLKAVLGAVAGDLFTVLIFLWLLTFAWEFLKARVLGSPKIIFAPTTLHYEVKVQTHLPEVLLAQPTKNALSLVVLFSNRSSALGSSQVRDIAAFASAAKACEGSTISIEGFASSRPFKSNSDANNAELADARALAVLSAVKDTYPAVQFVPAKWPTYQEMHGRAKVNDIGGNAERNTALEALNRRVALDLQLPGSCLEK